MHHQYFMQSFAPRTMAEEKAAEETAQRQPPKQPKPAKWAAGRRHRRRFDRHSALSRDATSTSVTPDSATSSLITSMGSAFATDRLGSISTPTPTRSPMTPAATPPAPFTPTATSKKGHGILGVFKKEKVERPGSSDGGPATTTVPVTSLPDGALRSPKALKILGVPAPVVNANVFDNLSGSHDRKKGDATSRFEIAPWERDEPRVVRKSASKSFGVPWLTQKQEAVPGQQTNESTTAVSTLERFRSAATNKKAMWMLGLRPLSSRPRSAGNDSDSSSEHGRLLGDRGKEASGYHSDGSSRLRSEPRRGGIRSRRRARRKKAPKSLERMSPIVEAKSSEDEEELEDEDDEDEDDAELDVISEYSTLKAKAAPMGRSITAPTLSIKFVDEQEARSEDPGYEGEEEEDQQVSGRASHVPRTRKVPEMVQISSQSPLQHIERVLLNNIQARDLMKMEREREHMDEAKKRLFENHTNMKRDFDGIKRRSSVAFDNGTTRRCGEQQGNYTHYQVGDEDGEDDDDDDDFEYEEKASNDEAVVFVAEMMTVRRFPPGSAKLVDIPPHNSNKPPTSSTSNATQTETPRIVYLKEVPKQKKSRETNAAEDENANGRVKWGNSLTLPTPRTPGTTRPFVLSRLDTQGIARYQRQPHQLSPLSPYRSPKASHAHRRKARLDPSQNLLAGWIDSDSSTASRPLSFVADPDGLADQALDRAPTPPPKDPRRAASTSTTSSNSHSTSKSQSQSQPQPQTHSPERHHCVKGGHIFDAIDLEQAPDDIRLNRLDVNPFLHTPEGKREEVKIPVTCENWGCGVKCEKVVWRCRIPACRLVVCGGCQSRWEGERRGRAVGSWEGDQGRDI